MIGYCDCCDKERNLTRCWAAGIETFACWECRGWDEDPDADEDEDQPAGCTCRWSMVNTATIDPPHLIRNQWCPVHGRDPDEERERRRDDREWE